MKLSAIACRCLAALGLLGMTGCGGSSSSKTSSPAPAPRSISVTLPDGLMGTLTEDRTTAAVGGIVSYTLTLTNPTASAITYQPALSGTFFSNAPAYLAVTDPAGALAFPTGIIAQYGGIGPSTTLAPGQSASGTVAVGSAGLTGQGGYTVTGQYTATASFAVYPGASGGTLISAVTEPLPVSVQ